MQQTTTLTGRVRPSLDAYSIYNWETVTEAVDEAGLGVCIVSGDDLTGELVFDFTGEAKVCFTAGDWGFASFLAGFFENLEDFNYSGSFRLETRKGYTDGVFVKTLEVIDSQVFNSDNGILSLVNPSPRKSVEFTAQEVSPLH